MKTVVNNDPTDPNLILTFYPFCSDDSTDEQAKKSNTANYEIYHNPIKDEIVITKFSNFTVQEIEEYAQNLLTICKEARAIAQERGVEVG